MSWGFLSGLGRGMTAYGEVLGKRHEMDWQNKRDEVQYKRQVALEALRVQNNRALAEDQRTWQSGENTAQRTHSLTMQDDAQAFTGRENIAQRAHAVSMQDDAQEGAMSQLERGNQLTVGRQVVGYVDGTPVTKDEYSQLGPNQMKIFKPKAQYEQENAISSAVGQASAVDKYKDDRSSKLFQDLKKTDGWSDLDSSEKAIAEIYATTKDPVLTKLLTGRGTKVSPDMIKAASSVLENDEQFIKASPKKKMEMTMAAITMATGHYDRDTSTTKLVEMAEGFAAGTLTEEKLRAVGDNNPYKSFANALLEIGKEGAKDRDTVIAAADKAGSVKKAAVQGVTQGAPQGDMSDPNVYMKYAGGDPVAKGIQLPGFLTNAAAKNKAYMENQRNR